MSIQNDKQEIELIVPPYAMNTPYHITAKLNRNGCEEDGHLLYLIDSKIDSHDKVRLEDAGCTFIRQECEKENGKLSKSLALFVPNYASDGNKISYKIGREALSIKKPFSARDRI